MSIFRKPLECYFCGTPCSTARLGSPSSHGSAAGRAGCSFRCVECGSFNRYDSKGQIMSDEPAMHDEAMNARSFARRASPRKNRLPSEYTSSSNMFCQNCKTNQTLLINLRASFLPETSDPQYQQRLAQWPAYEQSLLARYPPVCMNCEDNVSKEIARKDSLARTSALGGFLKNTKGKELARAVTKGKKARLGQDKSLLAWRIRGFLWITTTVMAIATFGILASGRGSILLSFLTNTTTPIMMFFSLAWTFWDPKYLSLRRAQLRGQQIRLKGRNRYIRLQATAWILRLINTCLLASSQQPFWSGLPQLDTESRYTQAYFAVALTAELVILSLSLFSLRKQAPPQVRLLNTTSSQSRLSEPPSRYSTPAPMPIPDADFLAPLSLSGQPMLPTNPAAYNPIFGAPSLTAPTLMPSTSSSSHTPEYGDGDNHGGRDGDVDMMDADAMDWSPTEPPPGRRLPAGVRTTDDGTWMRPQRFFAPEQPTGLEGLLARTGLTDSMGLSNANSMSTSNMAHLGRSQTTTQWNWKWVYIASLVPLLALAVYAWTSRHQAGVPISTPSYVPSPYYSYPRPVHASSVNDARDEI